MSDPIDRQVAIESVADEIWHYPNECYKNLNVFENAKDLAEHALRGLPSAQPEIIRCKDCRYYQDNNDGYPHINCKWDANETPDADDFCSGAERRTDDSISD